MLFSSIHHGLRQMLFNLVDVLKGTVYDYPFVKREKKERKATGGTLASFQCSQKSQRSETRANRSTAGDVNRGQVKDGTAPFLYYCRYLFTSFSKILHFVRYAVTKWVEFSNCVF